MKPLLALLAIVALTSCSNDYATATPGFYKEVTPIDPDAQFGVFVGRGPLTSVDLELRSSLSSNAIRPRNLRPADWTQNPWV
jgi:hypothetical protein